MKKTRRTAKSSNYPTQLTKTARHSYGIAVDLACGCVENLATEPLGEPQHVDTAVNRGLRCLDRVMLVADVRCGAGETVDLVDLHVEPEGHSVAHELKMRMPMQMLDVARSAREEIVVADHLVAPFEKSIDEVGA